MLVFFSIEPAFHPANVGRVKQQHGFCRQAIAAGAANLDLLIKLVNDGVTSVIAARFDSIASEPAPTLVVAYVMPMGRSVRRYVEAFS